jgi:histidine triad (HIT) family protein
MYNHAPKDYICPICLAIQGVESEQTMAKQADIVYRDKYALAYINSKFVGNNPGHVIVVPTAHFENLYELPSEYAHAIMDVAQKIAIAFKAVRKSDGVWIEQNNISIGLYLHRVTLCISTKSLILYPYATYDA